MGFVQYGTLITSMLFGTNGTERMRIDASGQLLINHKCTTHHLLSPESKLRFAIELSGSSFSIRRDE